MKSNKFIFAFMFILNACSAPTESVTPSTDNQELKSYVWTRAQLQRSGITTAYPQKRSIHKTLEVFGKIEVPPQNRITVAVPLGGFLQHSTILPGQKVNKGQVLATLQDAAYVDLQRAYLDATTQLNMLELEFKRQLDLVQQNATSQKQFEQTKAAYDSERILVKALAQRLQLIGINPSSLSAERISSKITLRSPVNGFVTAVFGNNGKYFNATEILFEIVDPSDIHLTLQVNEKDRNAIEINQDVVAFSNTQPDIKYKGKIVLINNHISNENTIEAHCHFEKYSNALLPGLTLNAQILSKPIDALTINQEAIFNERGLNWVFIQTQDTLFTPKSVHVGQSQNGFVELKNINPQDKIVITGLNEIRMKANTK